MASEQPLEAAEVASKLSEYFDREVALEDLLVVRGAIADDNETLLGTIAVTSFGNKVLIETGGDIQLLMGERVQAAEPIIPAPIEEASEEPDELPPLEDEDEEEPEPEDEEPEAASYEDWTVEELKDALRARELPVTGNKAELIAILEEDDAEGE